LASLDIGESFIWGMRKGTCLHGSWGAHLTFDSFLGCPHFYGERLDDGDIDLYESRSSMDPEAA